MNFCSRGLWLFTRPVSLSSTTIIYWNGYTVLYFYKLLDNIGNPSILEQSYGIGVTLSPGVKKLKPGVFKGLTREPLANAGPVDKCKFHSKKLCSSCLPLSGLWASHKLSTMSCRPNLHPRKNILCSKMVLLLITLWQAEWTRTSKIQVHSGQDVKKDVLSTIP